VRRLTRNPSAFVGLVLLCVVVLPSLVGLVATPFDPTQLDASVVFSPPSIHHPFGTDQFGRDLLSRVLAGGHITLSIGLIPIAAALVTGVSLGLVSGFSGGKLDVAIVTLIDVMLSFPAILLAMIIVAAIGGGLVPLMIAIAVAWVPLFARVARGSTLAISARPFVRAAVALGCSNSQILYRHILPNIAGPLTVLATLALGDAVLIGSALSFLGLGPPPPTPEWGGILSDSRDFISEGWWLTLFPGVAIASSVLGLNLLGDAIRDFLDPTAQVEGVVRKRRGMA
jgi:peptide/nickel transport system permease protein